MINQVGGGGAGNPGGDGTNGYTRSTDGENGVGGLLILIVRGNIICGGGAQLQCRGMRGGIGYSAVYLCGGGSSGGGVIIASCCE